MRLQTRNPSVAESILDAQRIIITGPPGTGKTTLAHNITQWRQLQFKGARRTVFDPTFSWNQHIWLQSVSLSELHQEQFVAGGGGQFHTRFWAAFNALDAHPQDALHTLVFDEIGQWPNLGFTRQELSTLFAPMGRNTGHRNVASILILPSASGLGERLGTGWADRSLLTNAVVLELLPRRNSHGVTAPSVAARYSPEGSSAPTAIALAELTLGSNSR